MKNRQFYIVKLNSSDLKYFKYTLEGDFDIFKKRDQIAAVADSQTLRLIRELTNKDVDLEEIEKLYKKEIGLRSRRARRPLQRKLLFCNARLMTLCLFPNMLQLP